ncbi:hypothetical protein BCR42DRAFT_405726 [Absidia repens]|uniref:Zn(2)-C6 fungal-type domain-containing protein n=1 Tax=Absidia repens TaxID=90262 RepID=A0A1X2ITX6_9FUNG|nr:hypothetical protein BCR42DRAFT_405726 [Absidia repens]
MFANSQFYQGYPQSQAPNTSGMNASQAQIPDHSQLNMPQPSAITGTFHPSLGQEYPNGKPKRKQVRNACTNCQKACKKCDDQRPCPRCVKYGQTESCVDSVRKERQKGLKRGPYKKRKQGEGDASATSAAPNMPVSALPNGIYPPPTTAVAGDNRGAIAYQSYGNTAHFENFSSFQNGQYLPYNLLNNMNTMIQQAAANANANGTAKNNAQQQNDGGNNNKASTETDENGKLSILSQLCTAVLDHNPNTTTDASSENKASITDNENQSKAKAETDTPAVGESIVSQTSDSHAHESTTTTTTTTMNNESNTTVLAESNQTAADSDNGSQYGTPEATADIDVPDNKN